MPSFVLLNQNTTLRSSKLAREYEILSKNKQLLTKLIYFNTTNSMVEFGTIR